MERKFIEESFPLSEVSENSYGEKYIRKGHPSTFHPWWTRKPLASSRSVNFASLINFPENAGKKNQIKKLIEKISSWDAIKNGNSEEVKNARKEILQQYDYPPKVLDPFAGGGSIPLEASRLGCETYSIDYNPIAVFLERAMCEWPQKFGENLEIPIDMASRRELKENGYTSNQINGITGKSQNTLKKENKIEVNMISHFVEKWANWVLKEVKKEIGSFYPSENSDNLVGEREVKNEKGWIPVGYIWVRTVPCQNPLCEAEIPLINQFWLSEQKNKKIAYRPRLDTENGNIDFEILEGEELKEKREKGFNPKNGTVIRGNAECPICGEVTRVEKIRELAQKGSMGERMVATVLRHPKETGKKYRIASKRDKETFNKAKDYLKENIDNWPYLDSPLPDEELPPVGTLGFRVNRYGVDQWKQLFNPRQKLALVTFVDKIKKAYSKLKKEKIELNNSDLKREEFLKAIVGYLGLIFSRFLNRMTRLTYWYIQGEKIQPTFSRQALSMIWSYVEINPDSKSSGSWELNIEDVVNCIEYFSLANGKPTKCEKASAISLPFEDNYFDAVFTDPPYYDNSPYGDLSDFFYVWLKRSIGEYFPELFSTPLTPKSEEIVADSVRRKNPRKFVEENLTKSFKEIYRVLKPEGITTLVYGYKTTEGWETVLNSLINSGFVVTASWPVRTEMKTRLRAKASAALASTIYIVCRKKERKSAGFWKEIKPAIKERIDEKLDQFWEEEIRGGDFFVSAIGPGMEIFSQYKRVEDYSGEKISTNRLLDYVRKITTNFIVEELLDEASAAKIDDEAQFYLAYRWTYLDSKVEFDNARKIASGMGVDLGELGNQGFVKKTRKYIKVLGPKERNGVKEINSMVDVMHKCLLLWEREEKDKINKILSEANYGDKNSFWQFCQAVSESLTQGNKEKQLIEGFLLGKEKYTESFEKDGQKGLDEYEGE